MPACRRVVGPYFSLKISFSCSVQTFMNCRDLYTFMGSSIRPFMLINLTRLCSKSYIIGGMTESCLICFSLFCGTEDRTQWGHKQMMGTQHLGREWCSFAVYSWHSTCCSPPARRGRRWFRKSHARFLQLLQTDQFLFVQPCHRNNGTQVKKKNLQSIIKVTLHLYCCAKNETKLDQIFHWKAIKTPQALLTLSHQMTRQLLETKASCRTPKEFLV